MDPATTCCPNLACPARGHTGQGTIGIHSRKAKRCLCPACQKTFTATKGTGLYRLRTAAETGRLVVPRLAHGCPPPAIVVACGDDERTGTSWVARAGGQGPAVQAQLVEPPRDLGHVQADAIRLKKPGGLVWRALARMVTTRGWRAGEVSAPRARTRMRRWIERVRAWALPRPLLLCPDGVGSSLRAMRETLRDPVRPGEQGRPRWRPWRHRGLAPVVKRSAQRRGGEVERRIVDGTPARVEPLRRRSQGDGVLNTAASERRNATFRERWASLTRRGRALARRTLPLRHGMEVSGTIDHGCTPHERPRSAGPAAGGTARASPAAMAAGITDHCWPVQELRSLHVPPPRWTPPTQRGRPSPALKRLMEQWCGDHG